MVGNEFQAKVYCVQKPPCPRAVLPPLDEVRVLSVAAQVAFESNILKPGSHSIDARIETTWEPSAFQLWVGGSQRAPGPPPKTYE